MSHTKPAKLIITRRVMLAGSAASVASAGLTFGASGMTSAAAPTVSTVADRSMSSQVCAAHHVELANHLKSVLNAAYVDDHTPSAALHSASCPHCKVTIAPDMIDRAAFSIL